MAQLTRVIITDDLDGAEGASTYRLGWQDTVYEVDLSDAHRDELLRALAPYIAAARKTPAAPRGSVTRSSSGAAAVRAWALANGHTINSHGRIPAEVRSAYDER